MPADLARETVAHPDRELTELYRQAGIQEIGPEEIKLLCTTGLWPGVRREPNVKDRGDETANASRQPWVDANGYRIGYLKALFPKRPPVLGYFPDLGPERLVPFDTLELALIEAWVWGGNYALAVEPRYREALLQGDEHAREAWQSLTKTARWLRENVKLFRQPVFPIITVLVEEGSATAEIANLLCRHNASPVIESALQLPAPDPAHRLAVVAANLKNPTPDTLAHAEAGSILVMTGTWWRHRALKLVRSEDDRDFYALGKGQVVAYKAPIVNPSEFALDVIDLVTHKRRAVRLWNAPAVIGLATGKGLLHLVNYGSPIDSELQARIQGEFRQAMLLRPESPPVPLKTAKRGSTTEVMVPELRRVGVVVFG